MNNTKTFQYKDYHGTVEADLEQKCLTGRILHINDLITYEANTLDELEKEFRYSVDDYLTFCKEIGKEPQKPYKGSFNIRISPEKHKKLAVRAVEKDCSINEIVKTAIDQYLDDETIKVSHNHEIEFKYTIENPSIENQPKDVPVIFESIAQIENQKGKKWIS